MLKRNSCDGLYYNSLDVRFTKACDNDCSFCIERDGIDALKQSVNAMVESTLKSECESILILGGEPFLSPTKLLKYIKGIRPHVREIFITTSLPNSVRLDNPEVVEIFQLINGVNISIQHYDWMINNEILRASSNHNRIEQLREIASKFGNKIRINLNLVKGQLDTKEKITTALTTLSSFGVNEIKLNELQNVSPEEYICYENVMGIKMLSPFAFGCQTNISRQWKGLKSKILLKRACFNVQPHSERKAGFFDFLKVAIRFMFKDYFKVAPQRVMYENGKLSFGWLSNK